MPQLKESLEGFAAIAWALRAPGANGTWKEYRILIVDKYVIVGWGTMGKSMQYKVEVCQNPHWAREWATHQTALKERSGYEVYILPRSRRVEGGTREWLEGLKSHRGSHNGLDQSVAGCLSKGIPLGQ